ncbi:MAG TPA: hypothetical protein VH208_02595, partial [Myxococcaceae bacterium]|nr:hypothetical protein [Myxococcaceae bacterium]
MSIKSVNDKPTFGASGTPRLGIKRDWSEGASPAVVNAPLPSQYLYAIGDLHGDFDNAIALLEGAGVIEK